MTGTERPPFRADHVGSLLRPLALTEARAKVETGALAPAALKEIEDRAIRDAIALQESVGLQSITDGEFRRTMWHTDFLTGFDGIVPTKTDYVVSFKGEGGATASTSSMMIVNGKVRRTRPIMLDHFKFVRAATKRAAKFCMPAPTYLHMRGGRKIIDPKIYPDIDVFWADITRGYRAEISDMVAAGCSYIQLDEVAFAYLCDAEICAQIRRDGEDPAKLLALYVDIINGIVADRPPALAVTLHTCRGNFRSMWMAEGGYEAVAEKVFTDARVDGFFLEYDTLRAGGFEPLRFVPRSKKVVLGLVSTKVPTLETKDELKRRIADAAKYLPLENLCLSPQCGFASTHHGNQITEDIQRRKLERVVEVAREVWGG